MRSDQSIKKNRRQKCRLFFYTFKKELISRFRLCLFHYVTRCTLKLPQPLQRVLSILPAHFLRRLKPHTKCRALRPPKYRAAIISPQLHATHPSRLALRHTGYWTGDRGCDATGAAIRTAGDDGCFHCDRCHCSRSVSRKSGKATTAIPSSTSASRSSGVAVPRIGRSSDSPS